MDYHNLVRQALYYGVGDLNPIDDLVDVHRYDKFLFEFPASYKNKLVIYLYDDSFNVYHDFANATLKVYEDGEWVIWGVWVEQLDNYFTNLKQEIQDNIEQLEWEKEEAINQENRRIQFQINRFRMLFGEELEEAVFAEHYIPSDKSYPSNTEFDEDMPLGRFLQEMFDAELTLALVKDED